MIQEQQVKCGCSQCLQIEKDFFQVRAATYEIEAERQKLEKENELLAKKLAVATEALEWVKQCAEILRGNELADQPYIQLFNETKKYEQVVKGALEQMEGMK